jgi:ABC-type uncharacterized transport system auxiliary subunit
MVISRDKGFPGGKTGAGLWVLAVLAVLVMVPACGGSPALINRFILDYPPPVTGRPAPLDAAVRVELFAVDEIINRPEMVYKVNPYKTGVYQYNRWRTTPGFLVTDFLIRDLRQSGLFKAVFSYDRSGQARFRLEGGVVEFQENNQAGPWQAALTLNITLLDTDKENIAERVMFQRSYQTQEPMASKTPQGLAEAMSGHAEVVGPNHPGRLSGREAELRERGGVCGIRGYVRQPPPREAFNFPALRDAPLKKSAPLYRPSKPH